MKNAAQDESKSLKTFFLYVFVVILIILVALVVKAVLIFEQSKFDGSHDFTLAVTEQNKVKEIIAFHPQVPGISTLVIEDTNIPYVALAKSYGITPNGYIQVQNNSDVGEDSTAFMWSTVIHSENWQSNLTVFDKIRLMLLSKSVTTNNKTTEEISLVNQTPQTDTVITSTLTDQEIADENISVQVINATNITGFGQRLGKVLTNLGANVIDVSTAQDMQKKTTIQYFGNDSYTVDRLEKLLGVTATKITTQPIANIVVTLGTDKSNTTEF
jgi:LytR cell envelope-related transcriptional attenuator